MELFHGPTFAFKDVALQFLGNLFEFFLTRRRARGEDARLSILGATSGDTGSAAISGLRGKRGVDCFMLYPDGRVSAIQEQQMATVPDANIHCIAIAGTFDDAQAIGRRYRRQDEIGTPYCVTVDFDTIEKDGAVTVRDRDTTEQTRMPIDEVERFIARAVEGSGNRGDGDMPAPATKSETET